MAGIFELLLPVTPMNLLTAFLMILIFFTIMFLGTKFLPGIKGLGEPLKDGTRKEYKLTGLILFLLATFSAILVLVLYERVSSYIWNLEYIAIRFWSLLIVANIFVIVWTILLFILGRRKQGEARRKGFKGILHDIWFGSELNPTWWGVDLKMFAYQPSLIGLSIINWSFMFTQLNNQGYILPQMWLYQAFWWFYLFTHYVFEEFMLSTWDIMSENFGLMLVWGDTVYVPFFYSIAGWFLISQELAFSVYVIVFLCVAYLLSIWIFRGANLQKYRFKKNPNTKIWFKPAKTLEGKILISGFWGKGRKLNYTGEILTYLVIVLTTGLISALPLILPGSLLILLMQRAWRDEKRCKKKYGKLWDDYREIAKYKMFPKIY
ncbi:MAG: hypothetical protein GOP50_03305 [Candidatus Heimdallarchaeota archaeon]|nr:hypothetical protein [Candidatus Heimdallarchaeota archaeon]